MKAAIIGMIEGLDEIDSWVVTRETIEVDPEPEDEGYKHLKAGSNFEIRINGHMNSKGELKE